jgi:outer membrane protein TolC
MMLKKTSAVITGLFLAGCAVAPVPVTHEDRLSTLASDLVEMFKDQEPLQGEVSLDEALARAIKYNLDNRLRVMEHALGLGQIEQASFDMLPKLALQAGYTTRNNYLVSDSVDVDTGRKVLSNTTSQERQRNTADLSLTWNVLDFGVSYFQAQQQADRALILQERRRKTVHALMQQVRQSYWQAVGAQALETKVVPLLAQVNQALADVAQAEREKLRPPLDLLNYKRALLDLVRQLEAIRDELAQAKPRLASLINLRPGEKFRLVEPKVLEAPSLNLSLEEMEQLAATQRPDLVEADLQERINQKEVKKTIARMFPGLELSYGPHYDSNSYLHNHNWYEGGIRMTMNLFSLLTAPKMKELAEKQVDIARAQRLALNMAVLSQVHVAYRDFMGRKRQYELAQQLFDTDREINELTNVGAQNQAQSRLNVIRSSTGELMADYRRYQSFAGLQASYAQIMSTVGVDPLPAEVRDYSVATLTEAIKARGSIATNRTMPSTLEQK